VIDRVTGRENVIFCVCERERERENKESMRESVKERMRE
jgi:hypothetical protein